MEKNNGFSKKKYLFYIKFLLVISVVAVVLLFLFSAIIDGYGTEDAQAVFMKVRAFAAIFALLCIAASTLVAIFGRFAYKVYARQIIDYPDDAKIETIKVTREDVRISYNEKNVVKTKKIIFSDYGIPVKVRKNFDVPVFYTRSNKIHRVIIPHSEEDNPSWDEYVVR